MVLPTIDWRMYTVAGLVLFIGYKAYSYESQISELELMVAEMDTQILVEHNNVLQLNRVIEKQNEAITLLAADYDTNVKEFEAWKAKPKKIKYVDVVKYVNVEVKSNECEDIKAVIDSIRNTSF